MTVRIRLARTPSEIEQLFALRHRIMVDDEQYLPEQAGRRLVDRFDAYPTTANVIAVVDGRVVGSIRFVPRTLAGTPADDYFDFAPFLPDGAHDVAAGMLVLEPAYRGHPRLLFAMFGMGYLWALSRGATHILAPGHPGRRAAAERMGYRVVAPEFHHEEYEVPVVPMILDLEQLQGNAKDFLRRQRIEHWLQSFERQFHCAGEMVLRRGDVGNDAYVVVDGRADVLSQAGETVVELGPGEVFGELAPLTDGRRGADIVARSDIDLMVISRDELRRQLRADPEVCENLLNIVATRMASMLDERL